MARNETAKIKNRIMAKVIKKSDMCRVYIDGGQISLKTPEGEKINRIINITADQGIDYSRAGYCKVNVDLWCKVEENK